MNQDVRIGVTPSEKTISDPALPLAAAPAIASGERPGSGK
jgi:hypothetical protein